MVYYTAIIMVLQLFTSKLITEQCFNVVDLLVLRSHLTVLRVHSVCLCFSLIHQSPLVTLYA
jgi:hypothetical protein